MTAFGVGLGVTNLLIHQLVFFNFILTREENPSVDATVGQANFTGLERNTFDPVLPSLNSPMISEIKIELQNSRAALRKLSQCLGTTVVSSSSSTGNSTSDDDLSGISSVAEQQDHEFAAMYTFTTNVSYKIVINLFLLNIDNIYLIDFNLWFFISQIIGDRYYSSGNIKIQFDDLAVLKGMNSNYLTSTQAFDYRFISRLLLSVFTKQELIEGCVKIGTSDNSKYRSLNSVKFGFVKDLFHERVKGQKKRFNEIYRYVNAKCSSLRSRKEN